MANLHTAWIRREKCGHCGASATSFLFDGKAGDVVCTQCGRVQEGRVPCEVHNRIHGQGYSQQAQFIGGGNIGAGVIRGHDGDAVRKRSQQVFKSKRLHDLNKRLKPAQERTLVVVRTAMEALCRRLKLPDCILFKGGAYAKKYLLMQQPHKALKKNKVLAAVCVCVSCKNLSISRTLKEISDTGLVKRKELGKGLKQLARCMNVGKRFTPVAELVRRYGCTFQCHGRTVSCALRIAEQLKANHRMESRSPLSTLSAVLYIAMRCHGNVKLSPRKVAETMGIAENTTTKCILDVIAQKKCVMAVLTLQEKVQFTKWVQTVHEK